MKRMIKAALVVATFGVAAMFAAPAQAADGPVSDLLGGIPFVGQLPALPGADLAAVTGAVPPAAAPVAGWTQAVRATPMSASSNDVSTQLAPTLDAVTDAAGQVTSGANHISGASKDLTGSATQVSKAAQNLSGAVRNIVSGTR
ncbi:hypothetical protein [Herbidospora sp. NBRC 101105]|uniref:hypothetical protein n=1 Tax=Herbidospora sp. NBRC 101105 TaxID=3032195 RepID=UPI00249FBD48|nr:hypothetical protein [Herbidospora sp. NBRC 101105]GLX98578.1 hypothetical protein Hesp01_65280 [Herbidospora sp. NBRC 101105]